MMILRQIRRPFKRHCGLAICTDGRQQLRFASVSAQILFPRPEQPQQTDYLQKYREKLERKAKEEGVSTITELRERYKPKIQNLKKKMDRAPPKIMNQHQKSPATSSSTTSPPKSTIQPAVSPIKTLSSFIDVDKLRIHTDQKEIELIWRAGHTKDNLICAVIPSPIYNRMTSLARHNPMFILPLPRENGIEMHFGQFKFAETNVTHILFTSLLEYKMHGEFARPHTTVMHFEDLADDKGIVLMRGEIDANQRVVGLDDALLLVMSVQKLYGTEPESERGRNRRNLVEQVTKGSEEFDINLLMDELNRID